MPGDLAIEQSEEYKGDDWWSWAVWIQGSTQALNRIAYVEWTLHPTFPNPIRRTDDRATNFRLETGGWGVFPIVARVEMKDGTHRELRHVLQLHYPDGKMTRA